MIVSLVKSALSEALSAWLGLDYVTVKRRRCNSARPRDIEAGESRPLFSPIFFREYVTEPNTSQLGSSVSRLAGCFNVAFTKEKK